MNVRRTTGPISAVACALIAGLTVGSVNAQDLGWFSNGDVLSNWRVHGEYLCWWSNGNPLPPLVTTSPPGTPVTQAGVLGTPGVETLFGDGTVDTGPRSGGRVTLSRWVEGATSFEFVGFYVADDYQSGNFTAQSSGSPILARPFFNAATGLEDSELVAFPGQLAGQVSVRSYSEAYSAAGLLRQNIGAGPLGRIDMLGGYRFFRYREDLTIRENLISTNPGGLIPIGTTTDDRPLRHGERLSRW